MTLIAHYPLTEDSGEAKDYSGNENHGAVNGATQGATGLLGTTAYDFDGTDDKVEVSDDATLRITDAITISAWVNVDSYPGSGDVAVVDKYYDGTDRSYFFTVTSDGNLSLGIGNSDGSGAQSISTSTGFNMGTGTWYHIAGTWDKSTGDIINYVDAESETVSTGNTESMSTNTAPLRIAEDYSGGDHFDGTISDVRVYDHTLSESGIQYLYDVGTRGTIATAVKTHGSSIQPDLRADVTLNTESATAYVRGSPGTASEEVQSASLSDGNNDYTLSWSNTHTDFRVEVVASITDVTNRVLVNKLAILN